MTTAYLPLFFLYHNIHTASQMKLKESVNDFLRFVFHEIRVPFNALVLSLDIMKQHFFSAPGSTRDQDETREHFDICDLSTQSMMKTMNDVLSLQKISLGLVELQLEPTDPMTVVLNVVKANTFTAREKDINIQLMTNGSNEENHRRKLMIDDMRMYQIISNLISNAVKFARSEIIVHLDVFKTRIEEERSEEESCMVRIRVEDDGVGISKENQEKLFRQFSQIKARGLQSSGGSGMGLWICRELAKTFGGELLLESDGEGKGATFTFEFRAKAAQEVGGKNVTER